MYCVSRFVPTNSKRNRSHMLSRVSEPREHSASGEAAMELTIALLQRARLAHPEAGIWEAADLQWWWRRPCKSDNVARTFWLDEHGPVAATMLTSWTEDDSWQCDPLLASGAAAPSLETVWQRSLELASRHAVHGFDVPVRDDDARSVELALSAGLKAGSRFSAAWLGANTRPARIDLPAGYTLIDRTERSASPHPLLERNGPAVEQRLQQCSLYDPHMDLAIEDPGGQVVAYSLYWPDPVTKVGLVEPVRVEDDFQRQGLAGAMLREGINRLFESGMRRVKVSYSTGEAGALYRSVGFSQASSAKWFRSA